MLREQFGLKPKEQGYLYRRPYPDWFDQMPMPQKFKVPDFTKFSGQDNTTTVEHISRYLIQAGEASTNEALLVRLFPMSLSGPAFSWFVSLPPNSIRGWADLEKQFHRYFFSGVAEARLTDLTETKARRIGE
jgi:Retrotransposon gag protein